MTGRGTRDSVQTSIPSLKAGVCIVGAGPAGLMAAIHAAAGPLPVLVLETNATAGRKLLLTGGGRCNFTHAGSPAEIAKAFEGLRGAENHAGGSVRPGRFLRHGLYEFSPDDVREFFHSRGLASTVEPDGCVFPVNNQAVDVRNLLTREAERLGVHLLSQARVSEIIAAGEGFIVRVQERRIPAARIILATGGLSWPQTGSTGDGYRFAERLGHAIVPPKPALVPLITRETWVSELAGVSLADVEIRLPPDRRPVAAGNTLFTQRGIGGPAILDLSRLLADALPDQQHGIPIEIDVFPEMDESRMDRHLQEFLQAVARKAVANALAEFMPRQFAQALCVLAGCGRDLPAGQLTSEKRRQLVRTIKRLPLHVTAAEPIVKATVTRGGVRRDEIDPRTMESKVHPGLFFAGELIDLDGPCGGYNLQMCWSTGALAGRSAARL